LKSIKETTKCCSYSKLVFSFYDKDEKKMHFIGLQTLFNYPIPFPIKTSTFYLLFFQNSRTRERESAIKMCHIIFHDVENFKNFSHFLSSSYITNLLATLSFLDISCLVFVEKKLFQNNFEIFLPLSQIF